MGRRISKNAVWVTFCGSAIVVLIIAVVTIRMMISSAQKIEETSKQNILSLSRAAALLVTAEEMEEFVLPEDGQKPEYDALRYRLAEFNEISGTKYTYFLRLDTETNMMQFIIDNTLLEDSALMLPQVPREYAPDVALAGTANTVEFGSYSDGWEGYMTAFAPVYYSDGRISNVVAGVDILDVNIRAAQENMNTLSILLLISIVLVLGACLSSLWLYQRQTKNALLASEAKSFFLSNTSHEIRTPMNAILGMVDLIMHEEISDIVLSHTTDIRNACRGLLNIINDILDISKIESGKLEIVPANYSVASLLIDTISIVKMRTDKKKITLAVDIDPTIPSELIGDELRIKQVLINLLNNAVKFTEEGQITLSVRCRREGGLCHLYASVKDTGIGIKPEDMEKIFVLFQQVDTKKNRNIEGTGLGLSISRQLVEMMGGSIEVKSEYGVGSTFTASIVQEIANENPLTALKSREQISVLIYESRQSYVSSLTYTLDSLGCGYEMCSQRAEITHYLDDFKFDYIFVSSLNLDKIQTIAAEKQPDATIIIINGDGTPHGGAITVSMPIHCLQIASIFNNEYEDVTDNSPMADLFAPEARVLVVDDNAVNLKVAAGLLRIYGIQADTASSGMHAVEMVRSKTYDLVFMDHMMPEMDGIDTTVAIRNLGEQYKSLPIIALTANAIGGAREMFKAEGLDDYLAKPIEMAQLSVMLKRWLPVEKQSTKIKAAPHTETSHLDIPGLDTITGIVNSGGSAEAYDEILEIYANDCEHRLADMAQYYKDGDIRSLTICVHAVKSASGNIGAHKMSMLAAELESAGKLGDNGFIEGNLQDFFDLLAVLITDINYYLSGVKKHGVAQNKPMDMELLKTSVAEIERHMDALDIDSAGNVLAELFAYKWDADIFECVKQMKACLDVFDYTGISEATERLKVKLGL